MKTDKILSGRICRLRQIEMDDCNKKYVNWLNDDEVNRFLETKWQMQNLEVVKQFVKSQIESHDSILFAILLKENDLHIGNIKIGPIHEHYSRADISYFIGEKECWNMGIATEAINLVCRFGFHSLDLHRIEAGAYDIAYGSQKALEKNGFMREGIFREYVYCNNMWINAYRYGLLFDDF